MRLSSQNNQFIFNLPENFISQRLEDKFQIMMEKDFIPYLNVISFLNSTIKDIVFPSISYNVSEQVRLHGKKIIWREAGNVMDKFQSEIDITFRSVDSHLNYFIMLEILTDFYLEKDNYLDVINIKVLDKDGDLIYTILLKDVVYKSLSELRMAYYATDFNEQTFSVQFAYNYIDIVWELNEEYLDKGLSIFDIPISEPDPYDSTKIEAAKKDR
jgi:hypothetical protein